MRKAVNILKRTRDGREALLEIIETLGGFRSVHSADPFEQTRLVAKRGVATDVIQNLLTDELDSFTVMMKERSERQAIERAETKKRAEKENDDEPSND